MAASKKIKVTLIHSPAGRMRKHRTNVAGLGLRRIGHTVEVIDHPATRGMVQKVRHLVQVVD